MGILDLASDFDAALDWALDDPLLADHEPSNLTIAGWTAAADDRTTSG